MSASRRGNWRALLLQGMGAVAIALAASLAWADALPASGPSPAVGGKAPILSPEAPPSFGDLDGASPLLAVFSAARTGQDPALGWPRLVRRAEVRPRVGG